jgi:hypothetical protein
MSDLSSCLHLLHGVNHIIIFAAWDLRRHGGVNLQDIHMIGLHGLQTVVDIVFKGGAVKRVGYTLFGNYAAAFCGKDIFVAAGGDGIADKFLTDPIAGRGVNKIDALVKNAVEHDGGIGLSKLSKLHRAVT